MKNILLTIVFFVILGRLSAQHTDLAVTVGTIGSKLTSESVDFDREFGIQLGLTADFCHRNKFSIRSGLMIKQKSSSLESNLLFDEFGNVIGSLSEVSVNKKINIGIQIPVLVHYHFNDSFGVYFGPSLELINQKLDYGINTGITFQVNKFEIALDYNQNFNDVSIWTDFGKNRYSSISMSLSYYFKQSIL